MKIKNNIQRKKESDLPIGISLETQLLTGEENYMGVCLFNGANHAENHLLIGDGKESEVSSGSVKCSYLNKKRVWFPPYCRFNGYCSSMFFYGFRKYCRREMK